MMILNAVRSDTGLELRERRTERTERERLLVMSRGSQEVIAGHAIARRPGDGLFTVMHAGAHMSGLSVDETLCAIGGALS